MRARLGFAGEQPGALQDQIDRQFLPGQFRRIALCADPDPLAIDHHMIAVHRDIAREFAVGRVVAGEMSVDLSVPQVVDRHDLQAVFLATFEMGAKDIAADSPVAVDCDSNCHVNNPRKSCDFTSVRARLPTLLRCGANVRCSVRHTCLYLNARSLTHDKSPGGPIRQSGLV